MKRVFFFTELQAKKAVSKPSHAPLTPRIVLIVTKKSKGEKVMGCSIREPMK
jgi:hypothetical protein